MYLMNWYEIDNIPELAFDHNHLYDAINYAKNLIERSPRWHLRFTKEISPLPSLEKPSKSLEERNMLSKIKEIFISG